MNTTTATATATTTERPDPGTSVRIGDAFNRVDEQKAIRASE